MRDRHAGAIKKQVAVGKYDLAAADGPQIAPPRVPFQDCQLTLSSLQVETARRDDDVLGIGIAKLFSRDSRGKFAWVAEKRFTVRDLDPLDKPR